MMQCTTMPAQPASPRVAAHLALLASLVVVAVWLALIGHFGSRLVVSLLAQAVIISILALAVGFLVRTSDLVSFGHAAPFGLGSYGTAIVFGSKLPPEIGIVAALICITGAFFLIGLVIDRLKGIAFSMFTLALGQFFYIAASKLRGITSGADGMRVHLPKTLFGGATRSLQSPSGMLVTATVALVLIVLLIYLFERSDLGRLAVGIRENEERVRFLGYRTRVLKASIFAGSALIAAVSGMLFALYEGFVSPEIVHWSFSGSALIMTIFGGTVMAWGPVTGAFAYFFLREWLSGTTEHWHAFLGVLLIVVTVAWPGGLSGLIAKIFHGLGLARKRRIRG